MTQDHQTADPNPLPARDEAAALATTGGDAVLAAELFATLRDSLPEEIARITQHGRDESWGALADAAHRCRGAAAYCGVPALDQALQALERAARNKDTEHVRPCLERVEREAARLLAYVPE